MPRYTDSNDNDYSVAVVEALRQSSFYAWQALTEHDPELATKYFDGLAAQVCHSPAGLATHLSRMSELYDTYSGCVPLVQLQAQEPQLSNMLVNSLPEGPRKDVRHSLRSIDLQDRTWQQTFQFASACLRDLQADARNLLRGRGAPRTPATKGGRSRTPSRDRSRDSRPRPA